jgi:hypothetical protein
VLLAPIPHVGKSRCRGRLEIDLDLLQGGPSAFFQRAKLHLGIAQIELFKPYGHRLHDIVFQVRVQHPAGREMPRMIWHDDRADPERARNVGSVQRTSPAVRDHCEIARIMPPLDGRHLDSGGHRQRSKVDDSGRDPV